MIIKTMIFSIAFISQSVFSQSYFTVPRDKQFVEYVYCQKNQNIIYDRFLGVIDSQIRRLTNGVIIESRSGIETYKLSSYKRHLANLIFKKIMIQSLKDQLNEKSLDSLFGSQKRPAMEPIFDLSDMRVDISTLFESALKDAIEDGKTKLGKEAAEEFTESLLEEVLTAMGKTTYNAFGKGVAAKLIVNVRNIGRSAVMSFGTDLLKGAAKGALIALVTKPLYGARHAPETIWEEIFTKHPIMILNPEWMTEAGSPDHPWLTHCATLLRRDKSVARALHKILTAEESEFQEAMISIRYMKDPMDVIMRGHEVRADGTAVSVRGVPRQRRASPTWARK